MIFPPAYNGRINLKIGDAYRLKISIGEYFFYDSNDKEVTVYSGQILTLVDIQFITVTKCILKFVLNDMQLRYVIALDNTFGFTCNFEELIDNDN